jgi:hypothetical protein
MSDENRNDAGQFTAEPEQKFGLESVEQEAGYTQMPDPAKEEDWSFDDGDAAAAEIYAAISEPAPETVEVFYQNPDGSKRDPSLTVTPERAADDLQAYHDANADSAAKSISKEFAEAIDQLRADRIKGDPALEEHYGVKTPKPEKAAAVEGDEVATHEPDAFDDVEGLTPETKQALRQPQVRQYLEETEREHTQVREAYVNGLEQARVASLATLAEVVPHLMNLPPAEFNRGLETLLQIDPPAAQRALNILQRTSQIVSEQQKMAQHNAQLDFQRFESAVKSEDARLEGLIGKAAAAEANQALVSYFNDHGIPRNQYLNTVRQNPVLLTAEARQTILKAAKYDAMQNAPKARPTREVPPVQRPGTSRSAREASYDDVSALDARLSKTGSLKDAEKLLFAKLGRR